MPNTADEDAREFLYETFREDDSLIVAGLVELFNRWYDYGYEDGASDFNKEYERGTWTRWQGKHSTRIVGDLDSWIADLDSYLANGKKDERT